MTGGFVTGIYFLYGYANDSETKQDCPSFDSLAIGTKKYLIKYLCKRFSFSDTATSFAFCYIEQYATTITITMGNMILPIIFSFIIVYEEYDPKVRLMVDLSRNILIRLLGLLVIIAGHIDSNK